MKTLEKKVKELTEQQGKLFDISILKYFFNKYYYSGCNIFILDCMIVDNFYFI